MCTVKVLAPYPICFEFLNSSALVIVHPVIKNWIKYAHFEEKHGYIAHGRKVFERAVEFFGEVQVDEYLYVAFARFEEKQKEVMHHKTQNLLHNLFSKRSPTTHWFVFFLL